MLVHRQSDVEIADRARVSLWPFVAACHQPLLKILCGRLISIRRAGQNDIRIGHATYFLTAWSIGRAADSGAAGPGNRSRLRGVIPQPVVLHAASLLVRHRCRWGGGVWTRREEESAAAGRRRRDVHPVLVSGVPPGKAKGKGPLQTNF